MNDKTPLLEATGSLLEAAVSAATVLIRDIPDASYKNSADPFLLSRAKAENIGHLAATIFETIQNRLKDGGEGYISKENENCSSGWPGHRRPW